jgi:hypothetical protein
VGKLFTSIQSITEEARRALGDPELSREQLLAALAVSSIITTALISQLTTAPGADRREPRAPCDDGRLSPNTRGDPRRDCG